MKQPELAKLMNDVHVDRRELMQSKGHDYADEDVLSNFKRMSTICALLSIFPARSATDCALFLAMLKLDRWCNLRRGSKNPANESMKDTIVDLHNYIDLAYACETEVRHYISHFE